MAKQQPVPTKWIIELRGDQVSMIREALAYLNGSLASGSSAPTTQAFSQRMTMASLKEIVDELDSVTG